MRGLCINLALLIVLLILIVMPSTWSIELNVNLDNILSAVVGESLGDSHMSTNWTPSGRLDHCDTAMFVTHH